MRRVLEGIIQTCRFYGLNNLPRIDVSITIGIAERRMVLRESIEEQIVNIFHNFMGEDFCRLGIYFEVAESDYEREYDIEDYCVYIGIEGMLPFL